MHFKGWYYYHRQTWTKSPEWWRTSRLFFFCRRIEYGHCRERQLVIRRLRVWRFFHACNSGWRSGSTKSKAERKTKLWIMNSSKNESKRIFTRHLLIIDYSGDRHTGLAALPHRNIHWSWYWCKLQPASRWEAEVKRLYHQCNNRKWSSGSCCRTSR